MTNTIFLLISFCLVVAWTMAYLMLYVVGFNLIMFFVMCIAACGLVIGICDIDD